MNLHYFYTKIMEELCGARDYIQAAIYTRASDPVWSKSFAEMSITELEHATKLFKMAEDVFSAMSKHRSSDEKTYKCIVRLMTEDVSKIRYMHEHLHSTPVVVDQPLPTVVK